MDKHPTRQLCLYEDRDGIAYAVHVKRDPWHAGSSVVKMTGFETINDAYINGINSMHSVWGRLEIIAAVPDDADLSRNPAPLSAIDVWEVRMRIR